jgi:hypothetical protein
LKQAFAYAGKVLADKHSTRKAVAVTAVLAAGTGIACLGGFSGSVSTMLGLSLLFGATAKMREGMSHIDGKLTQTRTPAASEGVFKNLANLFKAAVQDEASSKKIPCDLVAGIVIGAAAGALTLPAGPSYVSEIMQAALAVGASTALLFKAIDGSTNALDKRYGYVPAAKAA